MTESLLSTEEIDDLFIKPQKKYKILYIGDHILATSGVATQGRFLIEGLVATGRYSFRCLGAAIKHTDYRTVKVNDDIIIKPIDGFGNEEMIRSLLITEKPDAVFIFTDPRQYVWLFNIQDEISQVAPLVYWTIWDNSPIPTFNLPYYQSCNLLNCISKKTYELVQPMCPEKTHYIPHAFPKNVYYPLPKEQITELTKQNFGPRADWFKVLWVNRNAHRKMPGDVLESFKTFLDDLEQKHGHRNSMLVMHTDPLDQEGPNLYSVVEMLGIQNNVWFSTEKFQFDKMNILHNLVDCVINISKAEGYGLSTHISLQVGKPIIVLKTGGETDKVIDSRDGTELGVALEPTKTALVGSQLVPWIYEDYVDKVDVSKGLMKLYEMPADEKEALSEKCKDYINYAFDMNDVVRKWDETLSDCIENFKKNHKSWDVTPINPQFVNGSAHNIQQVPSKEEVGREQLKQAIEAVTEQPKYSKSKSKKKIKNKKFKKNKK